MGELEELAKHNGDGAGGIPNKVVVDLFMRKLEVSKTLWDDGSLPEEWWNLGEYDFQNMVRNMDKSGHGVVSWRELATYIILLKSQLPAEIDIQSFKRSFTSHTGGSQLIDQQGFAQVSFLF